ncbi:hypothetical protein [Entomospira culicis]|uniref:Uncharacterized protein n=1 Tax=Entomospira culicis TaxID=2719989 RepID=A0A968GJG0_9SPIO|nr:hypothetical protein [Entomospira culicis]NIZ18735.1 hypothetical protein [Entomospira culicis]NIZ68950.1 hypothetical protein [Entomospira culicis]WDI37542.1 hypothetical protein PVA46_01775 [Entomospira culicis]WDI39170.1 hypothetical protein PVA47_01780 [Entomospira culicis]
MTKPIQRLVMILTLLLLLLGATVGYFLLQQKPFPLPEHPYYRAPMGDDDRLYYQLAFYDEHVVWGLSNPMENTEFIKQYPFWLEKNRLYWQDEAENLYYLYWKRDGTLALVMEDKELILWREE